MMDMMNLKTMNKNKKMKNAAQRGDFSLLKMDFFELNLYIADKLYTGLLDLGVLAT